MTNNQQSEVSEAFDILEGALEKEEDRLGSELFRGFLKGTVTQQNMLSRITAVKKYHEDLEELRQRWNAIFFGNIEEEILKLEKAEAQREESRPVEVRRVPDAPPVPIPPMPPLPIKAAEPILPSVEAPTIVAPQIAVTAVTEEPESVVVTPEPVETATPRVIVQRMTDAHPKPGSMYDRFRIPILKALAQLGGTATPTQIALYIESHALAEITAEDKQLSGDSNRPGGAVPKWRRGIGVIFPALRHQGNLERSTGDYWKITSQGLQEVGEPAAQQPTQQEGDSSSTTATAGTVRRPGGYSSAQQLVDFNAKTGEYLGPQLLEGNAPRTYQRQQFYAPVLRALVRSGGHASAPKITQFVRNEWPRAGEYLARGNNMFELRKHLATRGFVVGGRNVWAITPAGREWLNTNDSVRSSTEGAVTPSQEARPN